MNDEVYFYQKEGDAIYNEIALSLVSFYLALNRKKFGHAENVLSFFSVTIDVFKYENNLLKAIERMDEGAMTCNLSVFDKKEIHKHLIFYLEATEPNNPQIKKAVKALRKRIPKLEKEADRFIEEWNDKTRGITPNIRESLKNELKGIKGIDWNN